MMENERLLMFTGAGFSASVSPKQYLTTDELYKLLDSNELEQIKTFLDCQINNTKNEVLDAEVLAKKSYSLLQGIELMGLNDATNLSMNFQSQSFEKSIQECKKHLQKLIDFIHDNLFSKLGYNPIEKDKLQHANDLINGIKDLGISFNIFSSNYDLLFESLLEDNRYYIDEPNSVNIDKLIHNNQSYSYIPLKGMVDWRYTTPETIIKGIRHSQTIDEYVFLGLEYYDNVAPQKFPHDKLYAKFSQDLSIAKTIIFVGYSFRDNYINNQIDKYSENYEKVIIVDKTNDLKEGFKEKERKFKEKMFKEVFSKFDKNKIKFIHNGFNKNTVPLVLNHIINK